MAEIDLLQQLRDLHLPQAPGSWPWAWGWWLILAFLIVLLGFSPYGWKSYRLWQAKRKFLQRLHQLEHIYQRQPQDFQLIELAYLLKQVALYYYPREQVAGLHGQSWLDFLQSTSKKTIPPAMNLIFTKMIYQSAVDAELDATFEFVGSWIKQQSKPCMS